MSQPFKSFNANNNNSLLFPSGKSVKQLKREAKAYSTKHNSKYNEALDLFAFKEMGIDRFTHAIDQLKRNQVKKITPVDNRANMSNANIGSKGTNRQYDQNQGNRGKQLNNKAAKCLVTFAVQKGVVPPSLVQEHKLRVLSKQQVLKLFPNDTSYEGFMVTSYDYLQFTKGIGGGKGNISGALQRIKSVMKGPLEFKHRSDYWIDTVRHCDKQHPAENHEEFEYSPFIDGFSPGA